jgi:hypothetical protein
MPRFETSPRRDNSENKPRTGLFQRLWKSPETRERQEKPAVKPRRKLTEILKHASTPREEKLVQEDNTVKKETRGLLSRLREDIEPSKRQQINELRKTVTKNPDISKNIEAVRAYQELIKLTDPERFAREIGTADGVYGPRTRKAYEADKQTLDSPRPAILDALSSNTPKETPEARTERTHGSGWLRNLFNVDNNDGKGTLWLGKFQSLPAEIVRGENGRVIMTYCSRTARQNLARSGVSNVPQPNSAIDTLSYYRSWNYNIAGLSTGWFNAPPGAKVADVVMSTGREHGHRSMAREIWKDWLVFDPYMDGSTRWIPLNKYKALLRARGWNIEGAAFYDQSAIG